MSKYEQSRKRSFDDHPMVVFGGRASRDLAGKIANYLDSELGNATDKPFPNGESMVRLESEVRNRDVFIVQSLCRLWNTSDSFGYQGALYTGANDSLVELCVWIDALRRASAYRITAVIPYFGYARQDRKSASRTPITARLVANMLETAGANRILTMDLHADQVQGFFNIHLDHLNAGEIVSGYYTDLNINNAVVLSADVGNLKKADKYRQGMPPDIDIAVIDKRRQPDGSLKIAGMIGDVEGKNVILLDDVISTAGTMREGMDYALKQGAKRFYLFATHGEFVGPAVERLSMPEIAEICVTDTIPMLPSMCELPINVLSVGDLFGEAIHRIHTGESISQLLGKFG